LNAQSL